MHTSLNGRADTVGPPINLGSFLPERRVVVINDIPHDAWVTTNRRYPRRVQAQLDHYRGRYMDVVGPFLESQPEESVPDEDKAEYFQRRQRAIDEADEAYQRYVTDSLMALIPTLDEETAELINTPQAEELLRQLGYFSAPALQATELEPSAGGFDEGNPLTGDISSQGLPASTTAAESTPS